jgi:hypothetical protein
MIVDVKSTKIYIISPGVNKYRNRLIKVFSRLVDEGFQNIIYFKSVSGVNNTASLTNTVLEILKKEMNNTEPFFIIEDDCDFFFKYDRFEVPDNWDMLYVGVSEWAYPYSIDTLYNRARPNIVHNSTETVQSYNDDLVKVQAMTSGHGILFNSRNFIQLFIDKMIDIAKYVEDVPHDLLLSSLHPMFNSFALKRPMFYQDNNLGGQEDVTKLTYNGTRYVYN